VLSNEPKAFIAKRSSVSHVSSEIYHKTVANRFWSKTKKKTREKSLPQAAVIIHQIQICLQNSSLFLYIFFGILRLMGIKLPEKRHAFEC
jgi:hypothetical protein